MTHDQHHNSELKRSKFHNFKTKQKKEKKKNTFFQLNHVQEVSLIFEIYTTSRNTPTECKL